MVLCRISEAKFTGSPASDLIKLSRSVSSIKYVSFNFAQKNCTLSWIRHLIQIKTEHSYSPFRMDFSFGLILSFSRHLS